MTRFDGPAQQVIARGMSLLRAGSFFEAHECFEEAWRTPHASEPALMRALAQLCAAYHQLTLGRARAAVRTWHKARAKLAALDALSPDYERSVEAFWARLGASAEAPRFLSVEHLPAPTSWPRPEYLLGGDGEDLQRDW